MVQPRYNTRPAHQIIAGLAKNVGLESAFGFTARQSVEAQIKPTGHAIAALDKDGVWQEESTRASHSITFATPSGKVEFASDALKTAGFDALPEFHPPFAEPDLQSFRLLTGHEFAHTGTSTQNNRYLAALADENQLWIHPARAARLGIEDESWVVVKSATGEVRVKAKLTEGIYPEAVWLTHGYGHTARGQKLAFGKGVNDNFLVEDRAEPIAGGAALGETIVKVGRG